MEFGATLYLMQAATGVFTPPGYTSYYELSCSHCTVAKETDGSVFVEWGSTTCPNSSSIVYSGNAVGSYYVYGGGSEYMCLPPTPGYLNYYSFYSSWGSVYTTQYQTSAGGVPALVSLSKYTVPCSLCQRPASVSNALLYVGDYNCPAGFQADYSGFLVAPHAADARGQFVCLSKSASGVSDESYYTGGALMYTALGISPLPPSYFQYYQLACAMCSVGQTIVPPPPPPPPNYVAGTTYIRWGRTTCPSSAALVYVGVAAGSKSSGSGANLECLSSSPMYVQGQYSTAYDTSGAISKAEYNTEYGGIESMKILNYQDIPCAVCKRLIQDSRTLFVPGTLTCPNGFSPDYTGYIFSPLTYRGEYVCIDANAEGVGSSGNDGGLLLSPVEVGAGSASPEYYAQGYEMTCVVCGSGAAGSVYTRWGRTSCPSDASVVYSGMVGGSFYGSNYYYPCYFLGFEFCRNYIYDPFYRNNYIYDFYYNILGGGSNYMCLSSSPEYAEYTAGLQGNAAVLRAEYETWATRLSTAWDNLQGYDVPCVVCQVNEASRGYSFVQPGSATCPSGFTTDYA